MNVLDNLTKTPNLKKMFWAGREVGGGGGRGRGEGKRFKKYPNLNFLGGWGGAK